MRGICWALIVVGIVLLAAQSALAQGVVVSAHPYGPNVIPVYHDPAFGGSFYDAYYRGSSSYLNHYYSGYVPVSYTYYSPGYLPPRYYGGYGYFGPRGSGYYYGAGALRSR
jgi:hypothetical protein